MKKNILSFLFLVFAWSVGAQSFLDEPFLYVFQGKRANEYYMGNIHPENNYALLRLPFHYPLSGMQLSDNFVYSDVWMNGKGNYSKWTNSYNTRKLFSFVGSDRSTVNGLLFNFAINKTKFRHEIGLNAVHRWKNTGTDQPARNDLNGTFTYKISPTGKGQIYEIGYTSLVERTKLEPNTGNATDGFFVFNNNFTLHQVYARAKFMDHYTGDKKRLQGFTTGVQLISLQQQSQLSVHRFDTDQQVLVGSVQYYNRNRYGTGIDLVGGVDYRAARINEKFDSVATIPYHNVLSTNVEIGHQFTNTTRLELVYRADLSTGNGVWLHNPGLKWTFKPHESKFTFFAYSQMLHRYVNVIPEYLSYLSTTKTIYRNPVVQPDEYWRSGVNADAILFNRLRMSVGWHYDYYTLRNVADVHTQPGVIHFYRLHSASFDQVIQGKVSYTLGRFDARVMYQYTAAKVKMNGQYRNLPFYSPSSFLASISYNNNYGHRKPEAAVSFFYSAPFILDYDAQQQAVYSKPGLSLNARVNIPLSYVNAKIGLLGWDLPRALTRFGLMLGCDNITDHKQNTLYSFSADGSGVDAVNIWGQYFGRRWFFGLSLNLAKQSSYYSY